MDKIQRTISLELFKIRLAKKEESGDWVSPYWGEIAKDFAITGGTMLEIKDNLPLIYDDESAILRYGTMINIYTWLKEFIKSSELYMICLRNEDLKAIRVDGDIFCSDDIDRYITFEESLPSMGKVCAIFGEDKWWEYDENGNKIDCEEESAETCYKVNYSRGAEYSEFKEDFIGRFILVNQECEQFLKYFALESDTDIKIAINRACDFLNFAEEHKAEKGEDTIGYIDIPICINEDYTDVGIFTSDVDIWMQNKRYYLGDKIMDDMGDIYMLTHANEIEETIVPTQLLNFVKESGAYSGYTEGDDIYTYQSDYSNVYIKEENSNFYYVRAYSEGDFNDDDWTYCENGEPTVTKISGVTESKLKSLQRKKRSYDDDSNELPFIVNETDGALNVELMYEEGLHMNILNIGETEYYDYVDSIIFSGDTVIFTYYVGASEDFEGVEYVEEYPYEVKDYICNYNGSAVTFTYTAITYENYGDILDCGMELNPNKLYSRYYFDTTFPDSEKFQEVVYFKNENLMGVQKISKDVNVMVERGKSAAFERHQVLGEVSSFDDLITYKNGFFTLKSD